jgi:predicted ABC-type ATPase
MASAGLHVSLFFLCLPNAEAAIARVAERVRQGGHDIPETVIRRRFGAGLRNLESAYKAEVDTWAKYDNVGERPILLEWGENE